MFGGRQVSRRGDHRPVLFDRFPEQDLVVRLVVDAHRDILYVLLPDSESAPNDLQEIGNEVDV